MIAVIFITYIKSSCSSEDGSSGWALGSGKKRFIRGLLSLSWPVNGFIMIMVHDRSV